MANENLVRPNFCSGTITNNPLAIGGTTLSSAGLASLPAIGATEFCKVTLDPLGAGAGPEVVYVTAHTGSATDATIVRAREGTSAVQHASGTAWVCGPVASDWTTVGNTADRPSGNGLPYDGQVFSNTQLDGIDVYEASSAAWLSATLRAGTFTPQAYQNGNVSSSTAVGRYFLFGKLCFMHIRNVVSAAGSAGNAIQINNIPAAIAPLKTGQPNGPGDTSGVNVGYVLDNGSQYYPAHAYFTSSTTLSFYGVDVTTGLNIGVTPSFALASGDAIGADLVYEIA